MRKGLNPLPVYIGMAAAAWPGVMPADFSGNSDLPKDLPDELQQMLRGIQKYYTCEYVNEPLPREEIWRQGTVSVQVIPDYEYKDGQPSLLLIPSMINRSYILDLMEGRSMLRWMAEQGINAYLLDWGELTEDDGQGEMEAVILQRLVSAIEFLAQREGDKIHALGYCMGGTVLMGAAKAAEEHVQSLIMLAAPWDFHGGSKALLNRIQFWSPTAFPMIEEKGFLSVEWIQTLFASLDPKATARKFANYAAMEEGDERARMFIAVEDWLNDGVRLPSNIAYCCIRDWFFNNDPYMGEWRIDDEIVRAEELDCPALIIASSKDRLVEYECAAPLGDGFKRTKTIDPECGHIGMIAGQSAVKRVWSPIAKWVKDTD